MKLRTRLKRITSGSDGKVPHSSQGESSLGDVPRPPVLQARAGAGKDAWIASSGVVSAQRSGGGRWKKCLDTTCDGVLLTPRAAGGHGDIVHTGLGAGAGREARAPSSAVSPPRSAGGRKRRKWNGRCTKCNIGMTKLDGFVDGKSSWKGYAQKQRRMPEVRL